MSSDSEYINTELAKFRVEHSENEGWIVYYRGKNDLTYIDGTLLDWMKENPSALEKSEAVPEMDWKRCKDGKRNYIEISNYDWIGRLHINYKGAPIHFYKLNCIESHFLSRNIETFVLIAFKNKRTLFELMRGLRKYARLKLKKSNEIVVLGKDNIKKTKNSWDDLILPVGGVQKLRHSIESFFSAEARYKKLGLAHRRGLLFLGPPGNGKSLACRIIASNCKTAVIALIGNDIAEQMIIQAFNKANDNAPAVILFEDIDKALTCNRFDLTGLINIMDGLDKPAEGVLVIATANKPELIDTSLLHRPGRFDQIFNFGLPDYEQRLELLMRKNKGYFSQTALEDTAKQTVGFSMSYVQEIVVQAGLLSIADNAEPQDAHLEQSLKNVKKQFETMEAKKSLSENSQNKVGFLSEER